MTKLTDNKIYYIRTNIDIADVDLHSYLVDIHLQKLEAAKIESIEFNVNRSVLQIGEVGPTAHIDIAVVNDPDDQTTLAMPDGESQHDVIAQFTGTLTGTQNVVLSKQESEHYYEYGEDEDIYCLRNIRINSQCITAGYAPTGDGYVIIGYRLEPVKVSDYENIIENL